MINIIRRKREITNFIVYLSFKSLFVFTFFISTYGFSQTIKLQGKVLDSLQQPLVYANIIAEPKEDLEMRFAITDEQGRFKLLLQKNEEYSIRVSFLGYNPKKLSFLAAENTVKNFTLTESNNVLEEVTINTQLAIIIKEDTIRYKTKYFVTGEERKLRDVLKKLPGVEVDRAGNVKVQGRRITKVLVENKQFFTGDSKLAVNNIPADAVDEVEILDNYSDVAILKGLEDSNELAMNIKLKEDKKRFWFGDLETGGGLKNRYLVHPSLFYYSPKRSMNFIGDFNNTGKKSFTFRDYLDFEGGYSKILRSPKAYFSLLRDDFSRFLTKKDFKNSKHTFGGFNITQAINDKTDLIGYTIYSKSDNELKNQTINEYINNNRSIIENRISKNNPVNQFIISKLGIDRTSEDGSKFRLKSFIKSSDNKSNHSIRTYFNSSVKNISTIVNSTSINFKQDLEWYKSINEKQTITFLANYSYTKGNSLINWKTNKLIFQNTVPVIKDIEYSIFNDKKTISQNASILFKHYWVLGDFIHLYTTVGSQIYFDEYITDEYQLLSDNSIHNFNTAGFGNDIDFTFNNSYAGVHLKFKTGKITFKPGLFYHRYSRKLNQFNDKKLLDKPYLLPELLIKIKLKRSEMISLNYNLKIKFPSVLRLSNKLTLTNFNSIYQGNSNLENELYHKVRLFYDRFSLFSKLNYNVSLNYTKKNKSLKSINKINGINYVRQPIILDNADETINLNGSVSKGYGKFKISLNTTALFSEYLQFINNNLHKNKSINYSVGGGIKTIFTRLPNVELSYKKSFNKYKTNFSNSKFENDNFQIYLEYDFLNDFIFTADYDYNKFDNKTQKISSNNNSLNAGLFYQKENSPWGLEVSAKNLFDNKFKRNNSFSDFLITDTKIFMLPRMVLVTVSYKL